MRIRARIDRVLHRHKWSLRQRLAGVATLECDYCYNPSWIGDSSLLPVGDNFVYPNSRCNGVKEGES